VLGRCSGKSPKWSWLGIEMGALLRTVKAATRQAGRRCYGSFFAKEQKGEASSN
jgi:hypothetical protein